jgi:hypothetical protein
MHFFVYIFWTNLWSLIIFFSKAEVGNKKKILKLILQMFEKKKSLQMGP